MGRRIAAADREGAIDRCAGLVGAYLANPYGGGGYEELRGAITREGRRCGLSFAAMFSEAHRRHEARLAPARPS